MRDGRSSDPDERSGPSRVSTAPIRGNLTTVSTGLAHSSTSQEATSMADAVRKAVIPAAGLGTRFLPATKAQPKEMLPVVDKPAI